MAQRKTVLIIEDDAAIAGNLQRALSSRYAVLVAGTKADGLKLARAERPDAILLDVRLPDGTGIEVLEELGRGQETDGIPVLVLTNLSDPETVSQILKAGGRDYLVKTDHSLEEVSLRIAGILGS